MKGMVFMKLPNGYGSVVKLSGKRRKPYIVRKTVGWHYDKEKDKQVQDFIIVGYAVTRAEGLQMLADYNNNPFDSRVAKMTFAEVYKEWSKRKYATISNSNVKGYTASYNSCSYLHKKVFKDLKLVDLQTVIDTCGKNYPTLRKIKVLFNQLYDYALKNDICNKDYSSFVDIIQYKERNPNKYDRNKFSKEFFWEAIFLYIRNHRFLIGRIFPVYSNKPVKETFLAFRLFLRAYIQFFIDVMLLFKYYIDNFTKQLLFQGKFIHVKTSIYSATIATLFLFL